MRRLSRAMYHRTVPHFKRTEKMAEALISNRSRDLWSEVKFSTSILFQKGLSTTQCTHSFLEIIDDYNYNKSDVFVLMLDVSKAFDRVRYCKLFNELLDRDISPVLHRIYMYMNQTLKVLWCQLIVLKYIMVSSKVGFCLLSYLHYMLTVCLVD